MTYVDGHLRCDVDGCRTVVPASQHDRPAAGWREQERDLLGGGRRVYDICPAHRTRTASVGGGTA